MNSFLRAARTAALGLTCVWMPAAGEAMPVAKQNMLVQTYCAVCHSDAHPNGGLTLEHFDAAHPDPGVAAMVLSKLTSGIPLRRVSAASADPEAAALLAERLKTGAMGAAGVKVPDQETQNALVAALAAESVAGKWTVSRASKTGAHDATTTASIVQEVPSTKSNADANYYRLTLTCRADTKEKAVQLAWSPGVPKDGTALSAAVDRKEPVAYKVEGKETMATGGSSGPGSILLASTSELPAKTLTIRNAFQDEAVVFPFDSLSHADRKALSSCFTTARR